MVESYRGARQVGHGGADHGYRSNYLRLPDFGLTVTVLSNVSDSAPGQLATKVVDALIGDLLAPATVPGSASGTRTGVPKLIPASALAGTWVASEKGQWLTIATRDGKAWLEMDEPWPLDDLGNGTFVHPASGLAITPEAGGTSLQVGLGGDSTSYTRADPIRPSADDLDALAGTYWSEELGVPYEIVRDGGDDGETIAVRRRKFPDATYRSLAADTFGRGSLEWGSVLRFQRDRRGRVTGFTMTAGRIRNLAFTRQDQDRRG